MLTDAKINRLVVRIFRQLGPRGRTAFVAGERGWLTYRRQLCRARASVYDGGTAVPIVALDCESTLNSTHLAELTWLANANDHLP